MDVSECAVRGQSYLFAQQEQQACPELQPLDTALACRNSTQLHCDPSACDALPARPQVRQPGLRLEEAGGQLIGSLVELLDGEEAALRWQ